MRRLRYVVLTAALAACAALALIPGTASARSSTSEYLAVSFSHLLANGVFADLASNLTVAEAVSYNECVRQGRQSPSYQNDYLAVDVIPWTGTAPLPPGTPWAAGWAWAHNQNGATYDANANCQYQASLNNAGNIPCTNIYLNYTPGAQGGSAHRTRGGFWSLHPAP
jgi:hypothetical protein